MKSKGSVFRRGAIAGILAATAVAVFFLLVDVLTGTIMDTPAFLSSVLLGADAADPGFGPIALYTVLHYAVFIAVGVTVAWALHHSRVPAALLIGLVVGFLLFDLIFYASISFTGVDVVRALGWPAFLAGNLLAGLVLVGYLGRTAPERPRGWRDVLRDHPTLREGLVAGVVGAVAVAAWFLVIDLVFAQLFFTPAALGSAIFLGVDDPALVQVSAATIIGYTIVHFAAFVLTGLVFAALVAQADENPPVVLALALLFVTFETLVIGLVAIVASWLLEVIPWWSIAVGNLIAAAAMGAYLWKKHPHLARGMEHAEQPRPSHRAGPGTDRDAPVRGPAGIRPSP